MWCDTEVLIPIIMNEIDTGCHGYNVISVSEQQSVRQQCLEGTRVALFSIIMDLTLG